jgi:hypothetical protein
MQEHKIVIGTELTDGTRCQDTGGGATDTEPEHIDNSADWTDDRD